MVAMAQTINAGDVVQLKSGGPLMTVKSVGDNYGTLTAWCVWFEGTKKMEGAFPVITIQLAD
jgi:uncharacterized protein YodC (DUF2158 family)